MHGIDQEPGGAQLSVGWQEGSPEPGDQSLERAAAYAALLTRTLVAAGYEPRGLDVGLRRGAHGLLEMQVRGDVPHMPERDFASLARLTLNAANVTPTADGTNDILLRATLVTPDAVPEPPATAIGPDHAQPRGTLASLPLGRIVVGVVLGVVLGVLGLPRVELPALAPAEQPPRSVAVAPNVPTPIAQIAPTAVPALPTPPALPTLTLPQPPTRPLPTPRVLIAQRLGDPLPNWPNHVGGTAWFGDGGYHLLAREPGQFVAVGVPLAQPVSSATLTAEFQKVGGPAGGGYGLIVRDQSPASERDGLNQVGQYMVLEVGDRGDVGIWRRNETRWVDVLPWTHSDLVHTDRGLNALVVMLHGNTLRFEVNGEAVADLTYDGVPPQGGVGIFVGGDLNEVVLEWLRIEIS